jgi:hypothetical protein
MRAGNLNVLPVATVQDAYALLQGWPGDSRVGLFVEVQHALKEALSGRVPVDEARKSFVALLNQANMLAECDPV